MAQSIRDKIRSATVGKKVQFKTKVFEWEGFELEFRQPNLKQRKVLLKKAKDGAGDFDLVEFLVWSVIECTYEPESGEKVFDESDYDSLIQQNTGSFVEVFATEISELMNVETEGKN